MANRLRQQQQQQQRQQQQHQLQQHPQQQLHHPQQPQAPPQLQRPRSLPPSSELFAPVGRVGNINLPPNLHNSLQQQHLHIQNRVAQGVAQAAAAQSAVAGLLQVGVQGNGPSNITATGSGAGASAAPPSSTQPLPQGRFTPQGSGRNAFEHYSNVYASAWGGGGAPQQSQQHRQWQQQQQQQHQQQQLQQLQQLRAGMRAAGGLGRGGGSEFVGGPAANPSTGVPMATAGRGRVNGSVGSNGPYVAVPSGTEVVEVLDDDRAVSPPTGVEATRQLFTQQQQRQQQQQQHHRQQQRELQQRELQQRVVLAAATGLRIPAVHQRREDRGLLRPLDEHLRPIMPATAPGSNSINTAQRGHQPTGAALLRLLAAGQPHWYIGQEALPTGDCKTLLYIPELDRRPRMGVRCESMSLKLLTGQARLVEALAGMYMKSINFLADEGRGEFAIPGAPQAFLPFERALYAAGMRDGDVVTLVDGLPATQGTLAKLGAKAHSQCNQPCVACVRLTFLRPVGASPTMPLASPQSVIDRWRELVRIIVLDSVPESPRKQEVLDQLERLQDASTLRTLACHSFEGQLEVARTNAGRRTRSSVPEQGQRQQQPQLQQPQQYVLNSNVSNSNPSSAAPAAIATRPIVAQAGDRPRLRQQPRGFPILSIGDDANPNANGHAGGAEGFVLPRAGAQAGEGNLERAAAEAAPSAFVLHGRPGSDKRSVSGAGMGMGTREKVGNGGVGNGDGGVGDHARGGERSSSAKEPSGKKPLAKEPSAREGARGGDDHFSITGLAFVHEHWQDGVCILHHPEDGVAGGGVQGAGGALALRRLVKCWGVDVKAGMTKAQLEADLRNAARNGTLLDSGSFSYDIPEMFPAPSSQPQATVEAATASSVAVAGRESEASSSEQWCVEGQIVWVRGAFVAYMDGQAIEDNDVWCPGLVCVRMADPESGEGKGDPEAGSLGFVVDVLGQSQAEFEVEGDNLTGFPGYGENLETVRDSAESGLGSPPDHMSLAVAQAILACLKCGWDPQRGTNILQPALCNDQGQGDARVKTYAKAWGIDPIKLEDLLKVSWKLMRPVPRGQENAKQDLERGDWEHLRSTWRKIERMWRGVSAVERPSAGGSNSSSGGAKSVCEAVLAEGVTADGSAERKAAMPSGGGSHEEKGEGVRRNGGVSVATSEEKGREGEEEEGGGAGGARALSDKSGRSSPSQTGDGEVTSPPSREGSESARESDGGDRRGGSEEIAGGASNSASAKDTDEKGRPASPSAPADSAGHGESSAADSNPLPTPFLLPPPPPPLPPYPVGSSASDGDASGANVAGAAGATETNRVTVGAQGRVSSLPSNGAGVTGRTALKRSANEGKEGEEGGGAGEVPSEPDAKRAKVGPTKSIEGSTARTASPGTTNNSGDDGSGSDAHSMIVTATGASSNAAGDVTGDLGSGSKVTEEVGATAVTAVPGGDSSSMRSSIQSKGNGETASDGGGGLNALPTSTKTVEAAAEKVPGPAAAAGEVAAAPKGAGGSTTPAERAIAGADAPTPMAGSAASDDRARPTSGSQPGIKNKDVVSRPSGFPGEKAVRDPSPMPGGSNSPAAPPLPPRVISAASGEASGVADGEEDVQQPWRDSVETMPRRGRKFDTPPEFNENDFRDRTPRANGGPGVKVA